MAPSAWLPVDNGLEDKRGRAVIIDPARPDTVFAGTAAGDVFKSIDGGRDWQSANRGLLNSTVLSSTATPGLKGNGKGPGWMNTKPSPQVFINAVYLSRLTDEYLFNVVKYGKLAALKREIPNNSQQET